MNPDDNLQPAFFQQQSSLYHCDNFKCEQNDKTTHQFQQQDHPPQLTYQFLYPSPYRPSSFFFTPTSPKHFHFDLNNSEHPKPLLNTPMTEASISKKINFKELDQESDPENQGLLEENKGFKVRKSISNRNIKNVKGLRSLSESVYMIVSQLGKTKYKIVAERLISDIIKNGQPYDKNKDQHNVKRRVYDALNVLIAAGMLQKQGKEVVCNQPYEKGSRKLAGSENSRQMIEKQRLQVEMRQKYDKLEQKRIMFKLLTQKKQNISKIIHRNMNDICLEKSYLRFPLIGTVLQEQKMQILRSYDTEFIFQVPQRPILSGDVDLLLRIREEQEQLIKQEVQPENIYNVIGKQEDYEPQPMKKGKGQLETMGKHFNDIVKEEGL